MWNKNVISKMADGQTANMVIEKKKAHLKLNMVQRFKTTNKSLIVIFKIIYS